MKKEFKWFTLGVIFTSIITLSLPGFAANLLRSIDVAVNTVTITVDGQALKSDNFVYNGTTYAPVRELCTSAGKPVTWDGTNGIVYIGTAPAAVSVDPSFQNKKTELIGRVSSLTGYYSKQKADTQEAINKIDAALAARVKQEADTRDQNKDIIRKQAQSNGTSQENLQKALAVLDTTYQTHIDYLYSQIKDNYQKIKDLLTDYSKSLDSCNSILSSIYNSSTLTDLNTLEGQIQSFENKKKS